jgi:hypothetical protein
MGRKSNRLTRRTRFRLRKVGLVLAVVMARRAAQRPSRNVIQATRQEDTTRTAVIPGLQVQPGGSAPQEPPLIQPCSWKRVFSRAPISLAICLTRPSIVLLPLSSPYDFMPVVRMKPAGL